MANLPSLEECYHEAAMAWRWRRISNGDYAAKAILGHVELDLGLMDLVVVFYESVPVAWVLDEFLTGGSLGN